MLDQPIDTRTIADPTITGLSYRVDVVVDPDERPENSDGYDAGDIEAWKRDEWRFVGVIVTPILDNTLELEPLDYSLWSVAFGDLPNVTITMDDIVTEHPVPNMVAELRSRLAGPVAEIAEAVAQIAGRLAAEVA